MKVTKFRNSMRYRVLKGAALPRTLFNGETPKNSFEFLGLRKHMFSY
jgi:hypothetical protein